MSTGENCLPDFATAAAVLWPIVGMLPGADCAADAGLNPGRVTQALATEGDKLLNLPSLRVQAALIGPSDCVSAHLAVGWDECNPPRSEAGPMRPAGGRTAS